MGKLTGWKNHIQEIQRQITENSPKGFSFTHGTENVVNQHGDIQVLGLYINHFGYAPNIIGQRGMDTIKARTSFMKNYQSVLKNHVFEVWLGKNEFDEDKPEEDKLDALNFHFFLYDDLLIRFEVNWNRIVYYFHKTDIAKVEEIVTLLSTCFIEKQALPSIYLLIREGGSIETEKVHLTEPKLDIASNYNDDFLPIHETIFKRLNQQDDKGLVLLHGKPGTGKTSYLRFLAASVKKKIIFLPPDMAPIITDPNLIPLLLRNRNSILVIEDAEKIIVDRDAEGQSPVSTLLNLADGLLSDCLNIQVICSFNTDLSRVDKALMRKGRLIAKYEFNELETEKAQQLSDKLGFKTTITSPMPLTDIYNQDEQAFEQGQGMAPVGFNLGKTG